MSLYTGVNEDPSLCVCQLLRSPLQPDRIQHSNTLVGELCKFMVGVTVMVNTLFHNDEGYFLSFYFFVFIFSSLFSLCWLLSKNIEKNLWE